MDAAKIEEHAREIDEQGYTILRDAIEPDLAVEFRDTIRRLQKELGVKPRGNRAEGIASLRIYNLLAKDPVFQKMAMHDEVLPVVEKVLDEECLLSGMTAIDIGPGERLQGMHSDEIAMTVPRPHIALMCTSLWALTDFTPANGGTWVVPGSHRFDREPGKGDSKKAFAVEMPAGSVLVIHGSLWHSGGPNSTSEEWRLGVNVQYCQGYVRQQQNPYLGLTREVLETFPERLLRLCGFTLYRGIMGHVDGAAPGEFVLGVDRFNERAYDETRFERDEKAAAEERS
jgi:ectoine hydroxylase-related dioxygenase (phytanoyl-CoA dioxygenase family)